MAEDEDVIARYGYKDYVYGDDNFDTIKFLKDAIKLLEDNEIHEARDRFESFNAQDEEEAYYKSILKWKLVKEYVISAEHMCGFCDLYFKPGVCRHGGSDCPLYEECDEILRSIDDIDNMTLSDKALEILEERKDEFI